MLLLKKFIGLEGYMCFITINIIGIVCNTCLRTVSILKKIGVNGHDTVAINVYVCFC